MIYCPVCGRHLPAANAEEVEAGEVDGAVYVHDAVVHTETDIRALEAGVQ